MGKNENRKNCFVMMPFSTPQGYEEGHFQRIYDQIIMPAVKEAGFEPVRVDKNILSTDIVTKIFQGLTECDMAICDLSSKNPNVLYELGIRQAYNKPVLLIKDEKTEHIFDVGGLTTLQYNSNRLYENVVEARENICRALKEHVNNSENVINIIRGRLGGNFQASEIPTSEGMDNDDRILSLLKSLIDDVDSMKQQINSEYIGLISDSNVYIENKSNERLKTIRRNLINMRRYDITVETSVKIDILLKKINECLENKYTTVDELSDLEDKFLKVCATIDHERRKFLTDANIKQK